MLVEMLVVPVAPEDGQAPEEGGASPGTGIAFWRRYRCLNNPRGGIMFVMAVQKYNF